MHPPARATPTEIPISSIVFGYGPTIPLVLAAVGVWVAPLTGRAFVSALAIIWGAIILVFVAGVRRGYGFGDPAASTLREIAAMLVYFIASGLSLIFLVASNPAPALVLQIAGFIAVAGLDARAAKTGDAPRYFARLRPPQMSIMAGTLAAVLARLLVAPHA